MQTAHIFRGRSLEELWTQARNMAKARRSSVARSECYRIRGGWRLIVLFER